ncbi:MAG: hypothetical protein QOF65_2912, partial [Thermoleophilaceae bacterium]|nr:hypothetical protein [Thermoleophilaceae bacterium]
PTTRWRASTTGSCPTRCSPEGTVQAFETAVAELAPGASVLDCAAGTDQLAVGLALRGFAVVASDASGEMVLRTQRLAGERRVQVETAVYTWEQLGGGPFDAVFCAATHSRSPRWRTCCASAGCSCSRRATESSSGTRARVLTSTSNSSSATAARRSLSLTLGTGMPVRVLSPAPHAPVRRRGPPPCRAATYVPRDGPQAVPHAGVPLNGPLVREAPRVRRVSGSDEVTEFDPRADPQRDGPRRRAVS